MAGCERSRAQREAMGDAKPRMRSRAEIQAEADKSTGERKAALLWVLG